MTIESFMVRDDIQEFIKEIKAYDSIAWTKSLNIVYLFPKLRNSLIKTG